MNIIRHIIDLDSTSVFDSEIISDTIFGNGINGSFIGGFGGAGSASEVAFFSTVLTPGQSTLELDYTTEGITFESPTSVTGTIDYLLSVDDVAAVPEPDTAILVITDCLV